MADSPVVDAGALDAEELLDRIKSTGRVRVRTEFLDSVHEVTLRWDGETFYCDTPTRLHKHDSESAMRTCLVEQGYGR
ncbi:hypothetical protein [Halosimplex pelagicum]|uniref:DUF8001 domain-containing protein n=1 Tax=Halosimplex pelagicum TaxID=869886 RepID=A0A7D5PA11_9EURY|nr:hypothetical protein [Halosimplex pelagicum]QLH80918.1 hypothetical protein HZS54_04365 [Halosimplex pelagicum]